jgi:hypothetical protein
MNFHHKRRDWIACEMVADTFPNKLRKKPGQARARLYADMLRVQAMQARERRPLAFAVSA